MINFWNQADSRWLPHLINPVISKYELKLNVVVAESQHMLRMLTNGTFDWNFLTPKRKTVCNIYINASFIQWIYCMEHDWVEVGRQMITVHFTSRFSSQPYVSQNVSQPCTECELQTVEKPKKQPVKSIFLFGNGFGFAQTFSFSWATSITGTPIKKMLSFYFSFPSQFVCVWVCDGTQSAWSRHKNRKITKK